MTEINLFEKLSRTKQEHMKVLLLPEYKGVWITAIEKYPGEAHFINELLQNADDANATKVEFLLSKDGLIFKHNGIVRFTISDVDTAKDDRISGNYGHINSITGLGDSQKLREQKIGKFGIGFKAVFAYTSNPEIYDDKFKFRLDNYIVPISIKDDHAERKNGETLFYFPFNHPSKSQELAYIEVENKLKSLQNSIIFLNKIREISWRSESSYGSFKKLLHTSENISSLIDTKLEVYYVTSIIENKRIPETFRIFTKSVKGISDSFNHDISIAFKVNKDGSFDTKGNYGAFCFFPTQEVTNQKFLIHAPFLLTDNRQNLLPNQKWNEYLISQLVSLTKSAFLFFRDEDEKYKTEFLSKSLLSFLPYNYSSFIDRNSNSQIQFIPFYSGIKDLFKIEKFLPGRASKFYRKEKSFWATDRDLVELFSDEQLSHLLGIENAGFVFVDLGQKNAQQTNPTLHSYIRDLVEDVISPEKIIRMISDDFMENQTVDWILRFYDYLNDKPSYLAISKDFPVVLTEEGKAIIPYDKKRFHYKVYLPTTTSTDFKTVNPELYKSEIGKTFFKNLGLSVPDIKAVFLNSVLKNYDKDDFSIDDEELANHTKTLLEFYKALDNAEFKTYIERLSELNFFRGLKNHSENDYALYKSTDLYKKSEELLTYFDGFDEVVFIDDEFYKKFLNEDELIKLYDILELLKIKSCPEIIAIRSSTYYDDLESFNLSDYSDNYYKTLIDKKIEGFENLEKKVSLEKSLAAWHLMIKILQLNSQLSYSSYGLNGIFSYQKDGRHSVRKVSFTSSALKALRFNKWLYDKTEKLCSVDELKADDLHEMYESSSLAAQNLISLLNFKKSVNDPQLSEDQKDIYDLGKLIKQAGYSEEEVFEALELLREAKKPKPESKKTNVLTNDTDDFSDDIPQVAQKKKNVKKTITSISNELFDEISNKVASATQIVTQPPAVIQEELIDGDGEYFPPIDLEDEYNKRIEEVKREIEELAIVQQLKTEVVENEKYSYGWFKALMELENLKSAEANANGKEISISFLGASIEEERIMVLSKPNRLIPHSIEEIGDLVLKVFEDGKPHSVSIEVVNVKEYTVRAKVRRKSEIAKINFDKVNKVVLNIKNPIFLLEKLQSNLQNFDFNDDYSLKDNLTDRIKFIFGPPGTGKTTYLATDEIIPLMRSGGEYKILVLTPTNKSADVLVSKIIEKMGDDNSYLDWLLRFGPSGDPHITEILGEDYKNVDINDFGNAVVVSTIARYSYDFFQQTGTFQTEYLRDFPWDYIIIDEASMITLPNVVNVLYSQPQADFIIAGDPFQISPISQVPQWKEENIYTMVNLLSFSDPKTEPHDYEVVNRYIQYRSVPAIGELFSVFSYDGKLQHHRTQSDKKQLSIPGLDFKDLNVVTFPVRKNESIFSPNSLNGSKYHIYSALFAVEFVLKITDFIKESKKDFFRIGIICPYKAQADIIEKIVSQQFVSNEFAEILVGTIHGFQGDECDIILTIFNPPFKIDGSPEMFLNKQNILNVAISRAKDYLFILMPDETSPNVQNLKKVNQIANLCFVSGNKNYAAFKSQEIEKKLFGSHTYIFDNSFATSHQKVNVYSEAVKKYEIRCEDIAVDVQIRK